MLMEVKKNLYQGRVLSPSPKKTGSGSGSTCMRAMLMFLSWRTMTGKANLSSCGRKASGWPVFHWMPEMSSRIKREMYDACGAAGEDEAPQPHVGMELSVA